MLKLDELKELIQLIDESSINEFEYEVGGSTIKLKKQAEVIQVDRVQNVQRPEISPVIEQEQAPAAKVSEVGEELVSTTENDGNIVEVLSPMVGTFYAKPSPENDPYVTVGATVKEDSIVCIIEAMKLFNEIEAEINGEIVESLVEDGQLVEFGQPLFKVKTK